MKLLTLCIVDIFSYGDRVDICYSIFCNIYIVCTLLNGILLHIEFQLCVPTVLYL